jgi:hypothetical protein
MHLLTGLLLDPLAAQLTTAPTTIDALWPAATIALAGLTVVAHLGLRAYINRRLVPAKVRKH